MGRAVLDCADNAAARDMVVRFVAFPETPFAGAHHYMVFMRGQEPLTVRLLKPFLIDAETAHVNASRDLRWYLTALLLSPPLHFGDYGGIPLKVIWALLDSTPSGYEQDSDRLTTPLILALSWGSGWPCAGGTEAPSGDLTPPLDPIGPPRAIASIGMPWE